MRKSSYVLKRTKADYIILLARPYVRKCKVAEVQGASKPSGKKLPACGSKSNVEKKKKKIESTEMTHATLFLQPLVTAIRRW